MTPRGNWSVWVERSGPSWRVRWRGQYGAGQQVFVYKEDAWDFAKDKRRDYQRMDAGLPAVARASGNYAHFRMEYLGWLDSRRSKRTRYLAEQALTLYEAFGGQSFPDRQKVRAFGDHLLKDRSANGARIILRHAKAAFRWALKEGMLDYDPFAFYEFPAAEKVARIVSGQELAAILRELPDHVRRPVFFVLCTGLRLSEVCWLDWSGIERKGNKWYLTVKKSKTRRKDGEETKTQAIHPYAVAVMGRPKTSGRVFSLSKFTLSENFREAAKRAGLGRVRLHDLRHTWATHLLEEIKDLRAVMDAGGWVTAQTAMLYQHGTDARRDATLGFKYGKAPMEPLKRLAVSGGKRAKKPDSPSRK